MRVEDVFSSKSRMKILKILIRLGQLNASEIASRLRINYTTTIKHLKLLEGEGILEQKMFGRTRLFRYNQRSAKAEAVQKLMEAWQHVEKKT